MVIDATRLTDWAAHPRSIQPNSYVPSHITDTLKVFSPIIAMTPIGRYYQIALAAYNLNENRTNVIKAALLTGYIAGMFFCPVITSAAAQLLHIAQIPLEVGVKRTLLLKCTGVVSIVYAYYAKSTPARVIGVAINMFNHYQQSKIEYSDRQTSYQIATALCALDLFAMTPIFGRIAKFFEISDAQKNSALLQILIKKFANKNIHLIEHVKTVNDDYFKVVTDEGSFCSKANEGSLLVTFSDFACP